MAAKQRRKFTHTMESNHDHPIAPNILRQRFRASGPNTICVADITYIPTPEGWLYLAATMYFFSRQIVGWDGSGRRPRRLVPDATRRALADRRPPRGLLLHSDRVSQYASKDFQELLRKHGATRSMS